MIEVRHLRAFLVVAEEQHFGRAAARLHMTQPPLSRQIAHLEDELGVQLLRRHRSGASLTAAGEVFAVEARETLDRLHAALVTTRRTAETPAGRVRMGYYCALAGVMIPSVASVLAREHPRVEVEVEQLAFPDQVQRLRDGDLDVALLRPMVEVDGLVTEAVAVEPVAIALRADHPLACREAVDLPDLASEPWILVAPTAVTRSRTTEVMQRCEERGFQPHIAHQPNTLPAGLGLVAAGQGVFPVPLSTRLTSPPGLAYLPIRGWTTSVILAWSDREPEPRVQVVLQAAREAAAGLSATIAPVVN